jgi:hypothetical protein
VGCDEEECEVCNVSNGCRGCEGCDGLSFEDLWKAFDNPLKIHIDHLPDTDPEEEAGIDPLSLTVYNVRVGSRRLARGTYNPSTQRITGDYISIFRGLGGKIRRDKRSGGVVYELNNVRAFYTSAMEPALVTVSMSSVLQMFDLPASNYSITEGNSRHNTRTGVTTVDVRVRTVVKPARMERIRATPAFRDFFIGVGSAIQDNVDSRFLMWVIRSVTRITQRPTVNRSSIKNLNAFYMGRVVGGVIAAAFSAGEALLGISLIIGSLAGGGFTSLMSGGTLTIAGAAVGLAGVTVGGALVVQGGVAASRALAGAVMDFNAIAFYRNNGNNGRGINISNRTLQHEFKHARHFGVGGNWSNANGEKFRAAIHRHIYNANQQINGTFRGTVKVTHYYDSSTGLSVGVNQRGFVEYTWKLSPDQVGHLFSSGNIQ